MTSTATTFPGDNRIANANYANAYPGSNALPALDHSACKHGKTSKAVRTCTIAYWKPIVESGQGATTSAPSHPTSK